MKVKVGQIWYHNTAPYRFYKVIDLVSDGKGSYSVKANQIDENDKIVRPQMTLGWVGTDRVARWSRGWEIKYPLNSFSRISPKTLRKRLRDQMASEVFAHRLTEQTPALPDDNKILERQGPGVYSIDLSYVRDRAEADFQYFQQRLIESLRIPSNLFNNR